MEFSEQMDALLVSFMKTSITAEGHARTRFSFSFLIEELLVVGISDPKIILLVY